MNRDVSSPDDEAERASKIAGLRAALATAGLGAVRLRGVDWFAWATAGRHAHVLATAEEGVAEVLVTPDAAFVLTDAIERPRLEAEEPAAPFQLWAGPWQAPEQREAFVREAAQGRSVASDRPRPGEVALPVAIAGLKRRLGSGDVRRYRNLSCEAAAAMTSAMLAARPHWTEAELAAQGAAALVARGIFPALILCAGAERGEIFRHPLPTSAPLGRGAMLVFCARRQGLITNLTRFVRFAAPSERELGRARDVAAVEAAAFAGSRPGAPLSAIYATMVAEYARLGHAGEEMRHHQGGSCGYAAREEVASPGAQTRVEKGTALAWNPSLPGAKIEDTVLVTDAGLEILTVDPLWPTALVDGRPRPQWLVRP